MIVNKYWNVIITFTESNEATFVPIIAGAPSVVIDTILQIGKFVRAI